MDINYIADGTPWYIYAILIIVFIIASVIFIVSVLIPGIRSRKRFFDELKRKNRKR